MEVIGRAQGVWHCRQCHCLFHLSCIQKWCSNSLRPASKLLASVFSNIDVVWHCPACRHRFTEDEYPEQYRCFCGKMKNPADDPWVDPHTCGATCGKAFPCGHTCTQLCHAGPCGACPQTLTVGCHCGKETTRMRCGGSAGDKPVYACGKPCNRAMACGHACQTPCHAGPCPPCSVKLTGVACRCRSAAKDLLCGDRDWGCGIECTAMLACGHHQCGRKCHASPCPPCSLAGRRTCHCGSTTFPDGVLMCFDVCFACGSARAHPRLALPRPAADMPCTEPTPGCGDTCGKPMSCGLHTCARRCHAGPCGDCRELLDARCRCGRASKRKPCFDSR